MRQDLAIAAGLAYADVVRYADALLVAGQCQCGCGKPGAWIYRKNPDGSSDLIAQGTGVDPFVAMVTAHVEFLRALDEGEERKKEIAVLEEMWRKS